MENISRESFVFYRSFKEAIEECPKDEQLEIYKAITDFALDGVKPNLTSPFGKVCWMLIEPVLIANWKRYVNGCKGKEHGAKGGNPSFSKGKRNPYYPKDNPKITPNVDVDVDIIDSSLHSESSSSCDDPQICNAIVKTEDAGKNNGCVDCHSLVNFFNKTMCSNNAQIPQIRDISGRRKNAVNARAKNYGIQSIKLVIEKAAVSTFLNGGGDKAFLASFDWLMKPENFRKVMEGNYDNRSNALAAVPSVSVMFHSDDVAVQRAYNGNYGTNRQPNSTPQSRAEDASAIIARLAAEDDARQCST